MEREAASGGFRGRGGAWGSAAGEGAGRRGGRGPSWHGGSQVWSEQQQQPQPPRPRQPQPQPQPHVGVGVGGPPGSQWVGPTSEGSSWASKVSGASASASGIGSSGGKVVRGQGDSKWVEVGRTAPSIPSQPQPQPQPPSPPPSVAGIRSGSLLFSAFLFFSFLFSFFCVLIKLGKPSWKIMVLKVVSL